MDSGKRITVDGWLITERSYAILVDAFHAVGLPESDIILSQGGWHQGPLSGSTHDKAGAWDLSIHHIPEALREPLVVELRRRAGGPVWIRDKAHGGFALHIHGITRDEADHGGLSSGAQWQVDEYDAGRNGLSNGQKDYHPRPQWVPFVWPVTVASLEKEDDVFLFKSHANGEADGEGIGKGAQWVVHSGHAFQVDSLGATVSASVPVVLSASEDMDKAFLDSVIVHRLGGK